MLCPTDQTPLVMTDRQGVEIDYCPTCRGVWLDRGELDKIIDRASAFDGSGMASAGRETRPSSDTGSLPPAVPAPAPYPASYQQYGEHDDRRYGDRRYDDDRRRDERRYDPSYRRKKKESWLGDIFDF
jgi:Zn-finger nucleic acid-binding protein